MGSRRHESGGASGFSDSGLVPELRRPKVATQGRNASDNRVFGAYCHTIDADAIIADAHRRVGEVLGGFYPVVNSGVVLFSSAEVSGMRYEPQRHAGRNVRQQFEDEISQYKDKLSPDMRFGRVHMVSHPGRQANNATHYLVARLHSKPPTAAMRMRAHAVGLMGMYHMNPGRIGFAAEIGQPYIVLGEYPNRNLLLEDEAVQLQRCLRDIGAVTLSGLVIQQGHQADMFARLPGQ